MELGEPLTFIPPVSLWFSPLWCWLVFPQPRNVHFRPALEVGPEVAMGQ